MAAATQINQGFLFFFCTGGGIGPPCVNWPVFCTCQDGGGGATEGKALVVAGNGVVYGLGVGTRASSVRQGAGLFSICSRSVRTSSIVAGRLATSRSTM